VRVVARMCVFILDTFGSCGHSRLAQISILVASDPYRQHSDTGT
jgi:hypothetical protein